MLQGGTALALDCDHNDRVTVAPSRHSNLNMIFVPLMLLFIESVLIFLAQILTLTIPVTHPSQHDLFLFRQEKAPTLSTFERSSLNRSQSDFVLRCLASALFEVKCALPNSSDNFFELSSLMINREVTVCRSSSSISTDNLFD